MTGTTEAKTSLTIKERLAALEVLVAAAPLVIGPGETLLIRVGREWTPAQVGQYQEFLDHRYADGLLPFPVVVVHGDDLAVARPAQDAR